MSKKSVIYLGKPVIEELLEYNSDGYILFRNKKYGKPTFDSNGVFTGVLSESTPKCEEVKWVQVDRNYTSTRPAGLPIGFTKFRLPLKYDREEQKMSGVGSTVLLEPLLEQQRLLLENIEDLEFKISTYNTTNLNFSSIEELDILNRMHFAPHASDPMDARKRIAEYEAQKVGLEIQILAAESNQNRFGITLNYDFARNTSRVTSIKIEDPIRGVLREAREGEWGHYSISGDGYIWFVGEYPYKNLIVTITYDDTLTGEKNKISIVQTDTHIDHATGKFGGRRDQTYVVTQDSFLAGTGALNYAETINRIAEFMSISVYSQDSVSRIKSLNPLGMWKEPVMYDINNGACFVKVLTDGTKTYLNADKNPTSPDVIKANLNIDLTSITLAEAELGQRFMNKPVKGVFQIIEPDQPRLNTFVETKLQQTGITSIKAYPSGEKEYIQPWPSDDATLEVGTRLTIDPRKRERIPYRQCFDGLRTEYSYTEDYEILWEREAPCLGYDLPSPCMQYSSSIESVTYTMVDWEDQRLNRNLPNCSCIDVSVDNDPYQVTIDGCGCRQITVTDYYLVCPDNVPANVFSDFEAGKRGVPPGLAAYRQQVSKNEKCPDVAVTRDSYIYHAFPDGDVITGDIQTKITGLFSTSESLECYYTSSTQTESSSLYYYDVFGCDDCNESAYFSVSYGDYDGSGSMLFGSGSYDSPTKLMYNRTRLVSLDIPETNFEFYTNGVKTKPKDVYILNFYRESMKDALDPGNFEINLAELNGTSYNNQYYTGSNVQVSSSNKIISFIDNSNDTNTDICSENYEASYHLVSGSLHKGIHDSGTGSIETNENITTYGKVYPALGIVVFDADKLDSVLSFNTVTGSNINGDNHNKLFTSISGAASIGYPLRARSVKDWGVNHYFVRVPNLEANYTNNPTAITGSLGFIKDSCLYNDQFVYVTSVGLYNDAKELLAVAKFSKPIMKSFNENLLIKIKLAK